MIVASFVGWPLYIAGLQFLTREAAEDRPVTLGESIRRGAKVWWRVALLCVLVGIILHAMGFDPGNILESIRRMLQAIWDMGFDAVRWLWRYFLLGAIVVIPIWVIVRLARTQRS